MEEQLMSPLAVTHLLQHTLRSLCIHEDSQWVYAVFWRILPRNYPPPKWDLPGAAYDRSRGNRRNWILVWEDGFCNFSATSSVTSYVCDSPHIKGLRPELFFKMSHEIYNYGEGLIGKVAADHSHKWVFNEPEVNYLSAWQNPVDSHPRTWEAQFQSGIKTIALIAVREGVVQLGAVNKVVEDLSYVVQLRKKFGYLESIPGVLLPHPAAAACNSSNTSPENFAGFHHLPPPAATITPPMELYSHFSQQLRITPSMSSLEALLSKLPSVAPPGGGGAFSLPPPLSGYHCEATAAEPMLLSPQTGPMLVVAKEEIDCEEYGGGGSERSMVELDGGESSTISNSSSMCGYYHVNVPTITKQGF